jgi:Pregnancy-associated plasma protein-A/Secretion system C-terminal sorting domain
MRSILISILFVLPLLLTAQNLEKKCHTSELLENLFTTQPHVRENMEAVNERVTRLMANPQLQARNAEVTIPVVVHIVYHASGENISDAQVTSQIEAMTKDFNKENSDITKTPAVFQNLVANCGIRFRLAQRDEQGNSTSGIMRHYSSQLTWGVSEDIKMPTKGGFAPWNSAKYLNIWVCNMGGRSIGFASFPGMPAEYDGVVIDYRTFGTIGAARAPYDKGRTCVHEVGHWLGLYHTWGDAQCGDDYIHDTPFQESEHKGIPTFPQYSSCKGTKTIDMTMNFMEYVNDESMYMFTNGQKEKMWAVLQSVRPEILSSDGVSKVVTTGVASIEGISENNVQIYPNPVLDMVNITIDGATLSGFSITVIDANGQVKLWKLVNYTTPSVSFNMSDLAAGVYCVNIQKGDERIVKKIIKARE